MKHFFNYRNQEGLVKTFPDWKPLEFRRTVFGDNVAFIHANLIQAHKELMAEGFGGYDFLHWLAARPQKKFMYCDNGSKAFEIAWYGRDLNKGDIMGVHDWGPQVNREKAKEHTPEGIDDFEELPFNDLARENKWTSRLFIKIK